MQVKPADSGSRISGSATPLLRFANVIIILSLVAAMSDSQSDEESAADTEVC